MYGFLGYAAENACLISLCCHLNCYFGVKSHQRMHTRLHVDSSLRRSSLAEVSANDERSAGGVGGEGRV